MEIYLDENEYAQSFKDKLKENKLEYEFNAADPNEVLIHYKYPESGPWNCIEGIAPYSIILNPSKELIITTNQINQNCAI